jgi:hypothetical protein
VIADLTRHTFGLHIDRDAPLSAKVVDDGTATPFVVLETKTRAARDGYDVLGGCAVTIYLDGFGRSAVDQARALAASLVEAADQAERLAAGRAVAADRPVAPPGCPAIDGLLAAGPTPEF